MQKNKSSFFIYNPSITCIPIFKYPEKPKKLENLEKLEKPNKLLKISNHRKYYIDCHNKFSNTFL